MGAERTRNVQTDKFFDEQGLIGKNRATVLKKFRPELGDFEDRGYEVGRVADLTGWVGDKARVVPGDEELVQGISSVALVEVARPHNSDVNLHDRTLILIGDNEGQNYTTAVVLFGSAPGGKWFGGAGIYPPERGSTSIAASALQHSEKLAIAMDLKAWLISVDHEFAGTKAIIDETSQWSSSPAAQYITAMMFSPEGPFPTIYTGSDAGQTTATIAMMARGSSAAGGFAQIVGTPDGLTDTASYARYSMQAVYNAMRMQYPDRVPPLRNARAGIQALGKIGAATARMFLDNGGRIVWADRAVDITPSNEHERRQAEEVGRNIRALLDRYGADRIERIRAEAIQEYTGLTVLCPCADREGLINANIIRRLHHNNVKMILAGANGPFAPGAVDLAHSMGIIIPPEGLSNGGSAWAAANEERFRQGVLNGAYASRAGFEEGVLIPTIESDFTQRALQIARFAHDNGMNQYDAALELYKSLRQR